MDGEFNWQVVSGDVSANAYVCRAKKKI